MFFKSTFSTILLFLILYGCKENNLKLEKNITVKK